MRRVDIERGSRSPRGKGGEMGISSMVIFIAMILSASVAAALLISTMGELQQQAQQTGEDVMWQISTGLTVVSATGDRDPENTGTLSDNIEYLYIRVRTMAGSNPIKMDNVVIGLATEDTNVDLTFGSDATATTYSASPTRDPDDSWSDGHVVNSGDLIEISINLSAVGSPLPPSTTVVLSFVPLKGMTWSCQIVTPSVYMGRYVNLK
ncbi:MAG: hypothetical protein J7L88_02545 [Thermoplasmata archaeon]|nr:hypothetical protein [Thermoplasmata archaeon]